MDLHTYTLPALFGLVLAGATLGACHWRYGRRLRSVIERMQRLDAARQAAGERALQARRQVELLQRELAEHHKARAQAATRRRAPADPAPSNKVGVARVDIPVESLPSLPANGFAETQPMCIRPETKPADLAPSRKDTPVTT
jgi:hypothetical protein